MALSENKSGRPTQDPCDRIGAGRPALFSDSVVDLTRGRAHDERFSLLCDGQGVVPCCILHMDHLWL